MLVPRRWRFEVAERIDAQGEVVTPLDERDIDEVIAAIRDAGPAIIEAMDATIVMPPGWIATVDASGYIRLHGR